MFPGVRSALDHFRGGLRNFSRSARSLIASLNTSDISTFMCLANSPSHALYSVLVLIANVVSRPPRVEPFGRPACVPGRLVALQPC